MSILFVLCYFSSSLLSYTRSSGLSSPIIDKQLSHIELTRKKLESGEYLEKNSPFTTRTFKPYLKGKWIGNAVSYGCYRKGQEPGKQGPIESEILEDLKIVSKHWNLIRLYSADEVSGLILNVIKKHKLPIKVMLGVWLENQTNKTEKKLANTQQVARAIELANKYDNIVCAVSVGNETQVSWSAHRMEVTDLVKYIRAVRSCINAPVTTADDYNFWNKPESKIVADEVDFIVTHIYPLWNGIVLEKAIEWMDTIYYQDVQKNHPEKSIVIGETGWATEYNPAKTGPGEQGTLIKGDVSINSQEKFLIQLDEWVKKNKITTFLFEAFDESWKGGNENSSTQEIEKHWGVFNETRTPKKSFQIFLRHCKKRLSRSNTGVDSGEEKIVAMTIIPQDKNFIKLHFLILNQWS